MNVLFNFDMNAINGALFLNTTTFCVIALFPATARSIAPFTTIYITIVTEN